MERAPEEIRTEIDDVREDLGDTLETIGDRVAPQKLMARARADIADRVDDVKEKVSPRRLVQRGSDAVRRGARAVVGSDDDGGDGSLPQAAAAARGQARSVASTARGQSRSVAASARSQTRSVASTARSQGRAVGSRAGSAADSVTDELREVPGAAKRKAEGNPLAAGLLAFAGGFAAAALLPPSERERQLTQKARENLEPLTQGVAEVGRSVAGELESTARTGLERVKGAA
ncbi:MAG TPA: DUF3618 domain-containing protein, partial [Acidimicrobiales bacterium]|nr:DUF3618 domain-containing protein [Acidimicrobiales bacterium]